MWRFTQALRTGCDITAARGITLIETLVAIALLSGSALLAGSLFLLAANAAREARLRTIASALAVEKMEQLRSLEWSLDDTGLPRTDNETDLASDPHGVGGPGLGPSPGAALDVNTAGFVDYLDARGFWIGSGSTPAPGTAYVRRWSVAALPIDPARSVVIQVRVVPIGAAESAEAWRATRPVTAWLATVRTRTRP